ncbi:PREDICTED: uncharacterized protein LOC102852469 [Elephantulus edwardii]|uniref:uncharacterized protein LOC102852469 n=1 Tax=Elephantulus edwardii TaxID=28737 RepID=UPI0003F0B3F3|nr:PREDICTED: uncharacterized protein LOC102852469 [Elephantulus edwardii]
MNYQEIGNHTKVTEFILVGLSEHPTSQSVLFWTLMFLYMVTLAGNSVILFLVGANSQLHTPMYFFLGNLSLLDLLFSTSAVPLIMVNALQNFPTISYGSCFTQLAIRAFLALAECFLLAIMAYDRFVAISNPLRYSLIMSSRACISMALAAWLTAFLLTLIPILLLPISFCGHNEINHFSCEVQAIFKLLCSDTILLEVMMMAVLRIHPVEARLKAFSTCGSHLVVVTIYFGTLIYIYVRPQNKISQDGDKIVSIFYAAVTPMLNPLIYTLRNKDVKTAIRKVTIRDQDTCPAPAPSPAPQDRVTCPLTRTRTGREALAQACRALLGRGAGRCLAPGRGLVRRPGPVILFVAEPRAVVDVSSDPRAQARPEAQQAAMQAADGGPGGAGAEDPARLEPQGSPEEQGGHTAPRGGSDGDGAQGAGSGPGAPAPQGQPIPGPAGAARPLFKLYPPQRERPDTPIAQDGGGGAQAHLGWLLWGEGGLGGSLTVPFHSPLEVEMAGRALAPIVQNHQGVIKSSYSLKGSTLALYVLNGWTAENPVLLQASINHLFRYLYVVIRNIESLRPHLPQNRQRPEA